MTGNGPGAPTESSDDGHGAAYGGHGSGGASKYGDHSLNHLLGGSSGGSGQDGSGAGGGAIHLKASAEIIVEPNVLITANGGNGGADSGSGTGGGVFLKLCGFIIMAGLRPWIWNYGGGNSQTRGSSGGRVAFIANGDVKVGDVDVSGEWLSNPGSIFVGGSHRTILQVHNQKLLLIPKPDIFRSKGPSWNRNFQSTVTRMTWVKSGIIRSVHLILVLLTSGVLAMWCFGEISLLL